jgi:outer membrane biosynthesis protein TonB
MWVDATSSAQARRVGRCCALVLGFGLLALTQVASAEESFEFDIPAQPLAGALEAYGNITGRDVLFNSNLTVDRRSSAVRGTHTPDAALSSLLQGTGLAAQYATRNSFVLLAAPADTVADPRGAVTQYYGRIQLSLQRALCASSEARPGGYRIAMRLWIDAAGNVSEYERLGSTGTSRIDEGIDRTMRGLRVGEPPPATLGQPVSIVIQPDAPGVTMGCERPAIGRSGVAP